MYIGESNLLHSRLQIPMYRLSHYFQKRPINTKLLIVITRRVYGSLHHNNNYINDD